MKLRLRWYTVAALAAATVSILALARATRCPAVTFVVPDGFRGVISLVKDSSGGIDLADMDYVVRIPAGGEVPIRDDAFLSRCYSASVRSISGHPIPSQSLGTDAGGPVAIPGGGERWSTEYDGTRFRWSVE